MAIDYRLNTPPHGYATAVRTAYLDVHRYSSGLLFIGRYSQTTELRPVNTVQILTTLYVVHVNK